MTEQDAIREISSFCSGNGAWKRKLGKKEAHVKSVLREFLSTQGFEDLAKELDRQNI